MNTQEKNKLIAEFMGLSIKEGVSYYTDENDMFPMNVEVKGVHLPYHTSWDWLMPVVAKISRDAKYWEDEYREYLLDVVPYGHIKDVYDAVVNFINQYNK